MAVVMVLSLAACGNSETPATDAPAVDTPSSDAPVADAPTEPIKLTLWGAEEDQALLAELVEGFKAAYPDQNSY